MTVKQEACVSTRTGTNFTAIHTGALAQLDSYKLEVPALKRTVRGKLFIKELLGLTGMEISMNKLPAGVSVPFYHQHRENEETYVFLKGSGQMQVDGETVVRDFSGITLVTRNSSATNVQPQQNPTTRISINELRTRITRAR